MEFIVVLVFIVVIAYSILSAYFSVTKKGITEAERNRSSIPKRFENPNVIGGTNLDRFFVECVLADCVDFSIDKNVEKAKLFAEKYGLTYQTGIENLYEEAFKEHERICGVLFQDERLTLRNAEAETYRSLVRYAEFYGKEKKHKILTDRITELREQANRLDKGAVMLLRSGQQKEIDWATWGGMANGIAGIGAGVSTAIDMQMQNMTIRAQNEANLRAAVPGFMAITNSSSQNRANANALEKELELLNEKLISDKPSEEVFTLLAFENITIDVSETGAFMVTATVYPRKPLFIYDDVPAIIDGTVLANVYDEDHKIGSAQMVFPVNGVSSKTGIQGMCLSGAEQGKTYKVLFADYKLWLMEK
jgi:hypothetical protein